MSNQNHPSIAIPQYILYEKIERAARAYSLRPDQIISKLFLVVPVFKPQEGEIEIETKYGKLKVFFSHDLLSNHIQAGSKSKALLLDNSKYNYPKVSKVSLPKSLVN